MIFKTPGERTTLFASLLLSTRLQQALQCQTIEKRCTFVPLPEPLKTLGELIGVLWPVSNTPEGISYLSPNSSLGATSDRLQVLSTIDCMLHCEQVRVVSYSGEQGLFPDIHGMICLNKQHGLTSFQLPSSEVECTRFPTFHRFWQEQERQQHNRQFRSNINHKDPSSIDIDLQNASG